VGAHRRALVAALAAAALAGCGGGEEDGGGDPLPAAPDNIRFTSPDFQDGAAIPAKNTCDGAGTAPTLAWREIPAGTVELVLVVDDPDAPDGTFTHWTAYGIAVVAAGGLAPEGQLPTGHKSGLNSAGEEGWTPPCPPEGDEAHEYRFALYALKEGTTLQPGASPEDVRAVLDGALGRGVFTGTYRRGG
jgi:Raf kinase inhibitor-like YbhB/YbcL family protein